MSTLPQTDAPTEATISFRADPEFKKSIYKAAIDANMTMQQYCQTALSKFSGIPLPGTGVEAKPPSVEAPPESECEAPPPDRPTVRDYRVDETAAVIAAHVPSAVERNRRTVEKHNEDTEASLRNRGLRPR